MTVENTHVMSVGNAHVCCPRPQVTVLRTDLLKWATKQSKQVGGSHCKMHTIVAALPCGSPQACLVW